MEKFVVGIVHNPHKDNELTTVVGMEFLDCPGFYQFYSTCDLGHFRKRPTRFDILHEIGRDVFAALKFDGFC